MKSCPRSIMTLVLFLVLSALAHAADAPFQTHRTQNIIFVMTDGLRWQEVFTGAEERLFKRQEAEKKDLDPARIAFWRDSPEARREALMPFLWHVVAKEGQLFGNQNKGSVAQVTNGFNFSYPGYSEVFCGFGDPAVNSNNKTYNPNLNVLEWLNNMKQYHGKVAAFGAWDLFPFILNVKRSGLLVNAGYEPMTFGKPTPEYALLNRLKQETIRYWAGEPFDSLTLETALVYLQREKPRVLYVSLGETDEWAHEGRYDKYLESARRADAALKTLWETAQSMRKYRGKTTLIFCADHGRGNAPEEWKSHGEKIDASKNIWMAFIGPDTAPLGERSQTDRVTESQVAATVAAFLGEDFSAAVPKAGKPISAVLAGGK